MIASHSTLHRAMNICYHNSIDRRRLNSIEQHTTKRPPSVWVHGNTLAQDAREKLRAADEARSRRTNTLGIDGTSSSGSSDSNTSSPVGHDIHGTGNDNTLHSANRRATSDAALPHRRPALGKLKIPSSRFIIQSIPCGVPGDVLVSPLMFVDSDISSSPSPTDPPTSATSTDATTSSSQRMSQTSSRT